MSSSTTTPTTTGTDGENKTALESETTPTGPPKLTTAPKSAEAFASSVFSKPSGLKPPTAYNPNKGNISELLLNRNKKPLSSKNLIVAQAAPAGCCSGPKPSKMEPSTPSNVKRLQVNKWFNSPTDNLFSPCTRKLYNGKKAAAIPLSTDLTAEFNDEDEGGNEEEETVDENATTTVAAAEDEEMTE